MEDLSHSKLTMYLAVKAVCDAKPAVWQRSTTFTDAYADFCECIKNLNHVFGTSRVSWSGLGWLSFDRRKHGWFVRSDSRLPLWFRFLFSKQILKKAHQICLESFSSFFT